MKKIDKITDVEKYLEGIEAVIFDLDDTLYSEKDYVRSGYQAIANEFPHIEHAADKLWKVFEKGGQAIDEVLKDENLWSEDTKEKCVRIYRYHKPSISLYPGVLEMIDRIRRNGKMTGIITDGRPEGQRAKIIALGLDKLVDEIIVTDELGGVEYRKPNATAFRLMKGKLGIPFKKMVYVGDNLRKDFIAPSQLNMRCFYFFNLDGLY